MKASLSWLKEYVSIGMETDALADSLTMAGLEVEGVSDRYDYLGTVLTGRVVEIRPHPNATDLKLCDVDTGDRKLSIVCGAPNLGKGVLGAAALPGTRFPEGYQLERRPIRGVVSDGMLCSEAELGLGVDRSGIMVLDPGLATGVTLKDALELSDPVLEIDLTPNRPDCLSIIGIAREIAALQQTHLSPPETPLPDAEGGMAGNASVTIEVPDHCPRYAAKLLTGITVGPSPSWLQDRLMSVGLRPINNVVDVTNFVMMETGQPLHAFDFDRLAQNRIVVRLAREGETFTTLDGKQRALTDEMLMICDGEKPVALAGVMGGLNSEIEAGSTGVLIESACFSPTTVRKAAKKLGISSEASHRFERGVDPGGTVVALNRAAQLMADVGGGQIADGLIDQHPKPTQTEEIRLNVADTNRFLGTDLRGEEIQSLLESIEFAVTSEGRGAFRVKPPTFRVDIGRPVDLMEEVARLWGYNRITTTYPLIPAKAKPLDDRLGKRERVKNILVSLGFSEAINYSFVNPRACDRLHLSMDDSRRKLVPILNPLSEEQAVLRTSLIPGLLDTLRRNIAQQIRNLKLFEAGRIYVYSRENQQPDESEMLVGLWTGAREDISWHGRGPACDYYDIKGVAEGLFRELDIGEALFARAPEELCRYMLYGYTARIQIGEDSIGLVGQLLPEILDGLDLKQPAFAFEIDLDVLFGHIKNDIRFQPVSVYPATARDVTLIVDRDVESRALLEHVQDAGEVLVESMYFFDVFDGDPIPSSKKSVSFRIVYRSTEETLEDERINDTHRKLTEGLLDAFDASFPA